jgi:hypothetical protein
MSNSLKKITVALLILIAISVAAFVYEEVRRAHLLKSYEAPAELIGQLRTTGVQSVSALIKSDESMVCLMDGYGAAERLPHLNDRQRDSLPKSILPSEDMTWYLIFLSGDHYRRIYLLDRYGDQGIEVSASGCLTPADSLLVTSSNQPDGNPSFKVFLQPESKGKK